MTRLDQEKMSCRVPAANKKPVLIPRWKYELIEAAILDVLEQERQGVSLGELVGLVRERIFVDDLDRIGSLMWHVVTIKLEMEVRGLVMRADHGKGQNIIKARDFGAVRAGQR